MPIIELQRRLHEAGRIRIGQQVPITSGENAGKLRPVKLEKFRFTSANRRALDAVANLYGGTVEAWPEAPAGEQFQVFTEAAEIDVVVPPETMALTQHYELWSGGGCKRRCDGTELVPDGGPCLCDPEKRECKPHTRLSLMLAKVPGIGMWRLDTQGWYAAVELGGSFEMAAMLAAVVGRDVLPGKLRLEQKAVKRPAPRNPDKVVTHKFNVPVLDFGVDMAALAAGVSPIAPPALAAGGDPPISLPAASPVTAVPRPAPPSVAEQIASVEDAPPRPRRSNSPPPLPRTGKRPRPQSEVQGAAGPSPSGSDGAGGEGRHGGRGDPGTALDRGAHETAAQSSFTDDVDTARARALALLGPFDLPARKAWAETIHEEFGDDESTYGAATWERVEAWLRANLPGPEVAEEPAPEMQADVPGFCRDLHIKRQAIGLPDDRFRTIVSTVTHGRTISTKELKPSEAADVMRRLLAIEANA